MRTCWRKFRWAIAMALACAVGSLPSCASMGGSGMKYLIDPVTAFEQVASS